MPERPLATTDTWKGEPAINVRKLKPFPFVTFLYPASPRNANPASTELTMPKSTSPVSIIGK